MGTVKQSFKHVVTAVALTFTLTAPLAAQETGLDQLYQELFDADNGSHTRIARQITDAWERSGSAAMDLLYRRGVAALENNDPNEAVEHLTALVDHAPQFAEGYHTRASAYRALGLVGPAIDDLRQALVLEPRHFGAMFGFAVIMEDLGRAEIAQEVYETILEIYPLDPAARARLEQLDLVGGGQAL